MYIVFGFAHHHTMNFVAEGLLLYVWLEEIKERRIGFSIFYKIQSVLSKTKWAFLTLFLVYRLNWNLRYLRFNHHYAKEHLADMLNGGFWVFLYGLTAFSSALLRLQVVFDWMYSSPEGQRNWSRKVAESFEQSEHLPQYLHAGDHLARSVKDQWNLLKQNAFSFHIRLLFTF